MDKKAQAAMLFKMHLKPKVNIQYSKKFYSSHDFVNLMWYSGDCDMGEDEKIAFAYPSYVFYALFENGDLVEFSTEGRYFHATKVITEPWRTEKLDDLRDPEMLWEKIEHINMPKLEEIWGAPL